MQRLEYYILRLTVVFWFLFWGYILYSLYWPLTVFKYNILPLPVNLVVVKNGVKTYTPFEKVKQGETIAYHGDYCKYVGNTADITHSLERKLSKQDKEEHISDIVTSFDQMKGLNLPMGCHTIDPEVLIPSGLKPGQYRIIKNIHTKINAFRVVDLEYYSDWFTVI